MKVDDLPSVAALARPDLATGGAHHSRVPREEIATRLERFRAATPDGLRVVHGRANIRYLTGYDGGGFTPWLIVDDNRMVLIHYAADEDTAAALARDDLELQVFTPSEDHLEVVSRTLRERRGGASLSADLNWWSYDETTRLDVVPEDCGPVLCRLRRVKSEWEQGRLRESGRITSRTMDQLEELASTGARARELAAALYSTAITLGSDPFTSIPYVAVGAATFENHATWDWDELCGPYLFEFATNVDGYGTPLSRSQTGHSDGKRALESIQSGIDGIQAALGPGANPAHMQALMSDAIGSAGFHFAHRAGYSIGLGDTETWMESSIGLLGPCADYTIAEGMAFHVVGSVVQPGRFGVAWSNSIIVTANGCEVIT